MGIAKIRQQLHDYIDSAAENKLKDLFDLVENDLVGDCQLSISQKDELDKRYSDHQNGIGQAYTWEETIFITDRALSEKLNN